MLEASHAELARPSRVPRTATRSTTSPRGFWYLAAAVGLSIWADVAPPLGLRPVVELCLAVAVGSSALFAVARWRENGRFILEPPVLLVLVFGCWHFSYWILYVVHLSSWYRYPEYTQFPIRDTTLALYLCAAGLLALIAGLEAGVGQYPWRPVRGVIQAPRAVYVAAASGTSLVVVYFAVEGHDLVGHYADIFLEADPLRRIYNLGVVLALAALAPLMSVERRGRARMTFLVCVIAPVVLIAGLLGSRWVLLSAVLLILAARSMRGAHVGILRTVALVVLLAGVATLAKTLRSDPSALSDWEALLFHNYTNPITGLFEEMGQAFIAVSGTINLVHSKHLLLGGSIAGAGLSVVPSLPSMLGIAVARPGHELAMTYYAYAYNTTGFTIGFSTVAELYRNFGIAGVAPGTWLLGYGVGRTYRRYLRSGRYADLFVVYALLSLLMFGMLSGRRSWCSISAGASTVGGTRRPSTHEAHRDCVHRSGVPEGTSRIRGGGAETPRDRLRRHGDLPSPSF
jgi:hypothetical protein